MRELARAARCGRWGQQKALVASRPSLDVGAAERFWVDGLGLDVLWRSPSGPPKDEHALLMVGWPTAGWHLELVDDPATAAASRPSEEDLLVLYLGEPVDPSVVEGLTGAGGQRVQARNPYWEQWGVTIADPDGYRLVLSQRAWG